MKRAMLLASALVACAAPIEVVKVAGIDEAAGANGTKLHAVAVLRGDARAGLPNDATIDATKGAPEVLVPRPGVFIYSLDPDEVVELDKEGRVTAVKSGARTTRFVVGTATRDATEVRGELEGHVEHLPLVAGDRIELRGTFAPGETVPTGGVVETTRAWSALAFGGVLLGGAWLPSVILAATSNVDANHWLYVPIFGPWIAYASRDACPQSADPTACFADAGTRIALIADGILQGTGAALLLVGLPTRADIRWGTGKQARLRVSPRLGGGVSIDGTF